MFSGGYKKRLVVKRGLKVTVTILNISENPMEKSHKGSSIKYVGKILRKSNISN